MRDFLFPFVFEKMTINHNMVKWMKEHEVDYFYKHETLYADIFGTDDYYKIVPVYVVDSVYEVYYQTDAVEKRIGLNRRYPLKERVHRIPNVFNTVKVTFQNDDMLTTEINGDKDTVERHYLNNLFNLGTEKDNLQKAVKVEFLKVTWDGKPMINNKPKFIKFTDVFPGIMGEKLDQYFDKQGWKLEYRPAIVGYQVFFGKGVQVDNNYEYGFPYSYTKEELSVFANYLYSKIS